MNLLVTVNNAHKILFLNNRGLVPAVAEMRYLDKVKWLDLYGVDLHPVLVSVVKNMPHPLCISISFILRTQWQRLVK